MKNWKRVAGLTMAAVAAQTLMLSGVNVAGAEEETVEQQVTLTGVEDVLINPAGTSPVTPEAVVTPDAVEAKTTEEMQDGIIFTFSEDGITALQGTDAGSEEAGYEIDGTQLTIHTAGIYYVNGSCSNGSIQVKKGTAGVVLVLNGINLASETTAPLVMGSKSEVELQVYGTNVLSDSEANNDEINKDNTEAENAVIKAKSDSTLSITGGGELRLNGNAKNALKSNGSLIIEQVVMDIDAAGTGISNEESITVNGGFLTIKSGGDGIKSAADDEPVGSVTVNGGTIVIDSMGDGIQATAQIIVNDGILDITAYGGADAVYDKDDDSYPSAKGLKVSGSYDIIADESTGETQEVDATACDLTINGGTLYLNCADDAIHADRDVSIYGGYLSIASGDDGIHADYVNTIGRQDGTDADLYLYISDSVEAVEGAKVYMNAGTTRVFASDDGINAANSDLSGYNYELMVTGGNHYVSCSEGDGFDSNGTLSFTGGNTAIFASSGAGEGDALDCDGGLTITGGTVLAVGVYSPMASLPANSSSYVQFGAGMGGGMRPEMPGDAGQGGVRPGMPGDASQGGVRPEMPGDASQGGVRPEMPGDVSQDGVHPEMPGMPGDVSQGGVRPGMPGDASQGGVQPGMPGDGSQGGARPEMPGGAGNISIKNGDTVVVCDASGNAVSAAIAGWLPDASAYQSTYVFCWSDTIQNNDIYQLYVNGEKMASTEDAAPVDPGQGILGDLDGDGKVTLADAQTALKAALRIIQLENIQAADVDGDQMVTLTDAQKILRAALKIESLPDRQIGQNMSENKDPFLS